MPDHDTHTTEFPDYKVRVIFKGFVVSRINHHADSAMIGALAPSVSTCHRPSIHVYQITLPDGQSVEITPEIDLDEDFWLTVSGRPLQQIKKFQLNGERFERFDERNNSKKDFRWFINLDEIHEKTIHVNESFLSPQFIMNKGVFYTSARSDGEVRIEKQNDKTNPPPKHFARFATEITARVALEPHTSAAFRNGDSPIFSVSAEDSFRYDIVFDCTCRASDEGDVSDFPLVYPDVIPPTSVPDAERLQMVAEEHVLPQASAAQFKSFVVSPETYCQGGNHGG